MAYVSLELSATQYELVTYCVKPSLCNAKVPDDGSFTGKFDDDGAIDVEYSYAYCPDEPCPSDHRKPTEPEQKTLLARGSANLSSPLACVIDRCQVRCNDR